MSDINEIKVWMVAIMERLRGLPYVQSVISGASVSLASWLDLSVPPTLLVMLEGEDWEDKGRIGYASHEGPVVFGIYMKIEDVDAAVGEAPLDLLDVRQDVQDKLLGFIPDGAGVKGILKLHNGGWIAQDASSVVYRLAFRVRTILSQKEDVNV